MNCCSGGTELVTDFGVEFLGSLFEGKDLEQAIERGYGNPIQTTFS